MSPLVSIGMATRNHGHCIANAIDSLLSQTYKNIELIIWDGASEDDTKNICEEYARRDKRIRYLRQAENHGLVPDFANVLNEAKGKYFFWAADDDWWHPRFVEAMTEALEKNPYYGVAMSYFSEHFDHKYDQRKIGEKIFRHNYTDLSYSDVYKKIISANINPIFLHGLYRRAELVSLFKRLFPDCIDGSTVFQCEVALSMRFYSVPEVLHSKYRNPMPLAERHAFIGKEFANPYRRTRYIFTMLRWLVSSKNIPLLRKRLIFGPWFRYFWRYKYGILSEIRTGIARRIAS